MCGSRARRRAGRVACGGGDHVLYDRAAGIGDIFALHPVVTSSYIAEFAASVGAVLKDEAGGTVGVEASILRRQDGSEIKQIEAFLSGLRASPGGTLPSQYDVASPLATKRYVCVKGC